MIKDFSVSHFGSKSDLFIFYEYKVLGVEYFIKIGLSKKDYLPAIVHSI